jgi:uncharacterized OsmC-like protein
MAIRREEHPPELGTSTVVGKMNDRKSSKLYVRDFEAYVSDEKPAGGGENRGPSPLEYILMGLCA